MPAALRPAFEASLAAYRELRAKGQSDATLSRHMVERTLAFCEGLPAEESGKLVALLRRFEAEAAREDARRIASNLADRAALELVLKFAPEELEGGGKIAA